MMEFLPVKLQVYKSKVLIYSQVNHRGFPVGKPVGIPVWILFLNYRQIFCEIPLPNIFKQSLRPPI